MKRLTFILCVPLLFSLRPVFSQNIFSTPYSVYGIGVLNERNASLNKGLGGTGIGIQDDYNLNHANPASYGSIVFPVTHVYEVGTYLESNRYTTNELSESESGGGLTHLNYWFRFRPWWGSTIGILPFSSVSYNIATQKELAFTSDATYLYEGSGNITRVYWGNGFKVYKGLSLGVNLTYLFGTINRSESVLSNEAASALTLEDKTFTNKVSIDFGIQYKIDLGRKSIILGAVYDHGLSLRGKSELTLYNGNYDTLSQYSGTSVNYALPSTLGMGVSLKSKRSVLATDLKCADWSAASYSSQDVKFEDSWRVSMGYAYTGNEDAENYIGLIGIRTGWNLQRYHMNLKGNAITAWGASLGISLPTLNGKAAINFTYSFDQLGTLRDNLILQHSQKIMVDIVIRDLWGVRRKFD